MKSTILTLTASALVLASCSDPAPTSAPASAPPVQATTKPAVAPAQPLPTYSDILTSEGFGPLRIGMTRAEVDAAMGEALPDEAMAIDNCYYYRPERAPDGLLVMIDDGILTRITLHEPSTIKTKAGFAVGTPTETVKAAYGNSANWSLHAYEDPPAGYLTIWEDKARPGRDVLDPAARGLVYEGDMTGKIQAIHAGGPDIQLIEGCA